MTKVEILRKAALRLEGKKSMHSCTAIAAVEKGSPEFYTNPGPLGRLWAKCHAVKGVRPWGSWFEGSLEYPGDELRICLLEELALCMEEQGFA